MLLGSRGASGPIREDAFAKPWVTPGLEARLREVGFEQPEEIGATFLGDAEYLRDLTKDTPELVDDFPQRLVPSPSRVSLSDPRYATDSSVSDFFQRVIDPGRARELFARSPFIRQFWPAALVARTIPAFDYQRIINRVLWDGGKPLRQIEDLHFLLTRTPLRTLPLWVLGSDEVKQRIAESSGDTSGAVEYARALRALTGHGYAAAAGFFAASERRSFGGAQVRALHAYALCMAGQLDEARSIAQVLMPRTRTKNTSGNGSHPASPLEAAQTEPRGRRRDTPARLQVAFRCSFFTTPWPPTSAPGRRARKPWRKPP